MTTPFQPNPDPDWLASYLATRQWLKIAMLTCVGIAVFFMLGANAILESGDKPMGGRGAVIVSVNGQPPDLTPDELDAKRRKELAQGMMLAAAGSMVLAFVISLLFGFKYNSCPMCGKDTGRYFPTDKIHCPRCGRTLPENLQS